LQHRFSFRALEHTTGPLAISSMKMPRIDILTA
jgi:hypothetical protein